MAVRASELLLVVRAQNQASQALRRIGNDVRGLNRMQTTQAALQRNQIEMQTLQRQRQRALNELESVASVNGKRKLANAEALLRNQRQMIGAEQKLASLNKAYNVKGSLARDTRGRFLNAGSVPQLQQAALHVRELQVQAEKLAATETQLAQRAAVLNSELATTTQRMAMLTAQARALEHEINAARWDRIGAVGRTMQHTARIVQMGGLVVGASLVYAGSKAAEFSKEVTLAATQARALGAGAADTARKSKTLGHEIIELMKQVPVASGDLAKSAYDIFSSTNVSFKGGIKTLKLFAKAAVAGQTDVQTATSAAITVLNNFGSDVSTLPKKLNEMFAAVRFGRITFDEFAKSMATTGPAARAANQTFESMIGTFAFLTRHLDVSKARTGYARLLEALASPKMLAGLQKVGISIQDTNHHLLPLDQIIGKILTKFPQLAKGGTDAMNFFKNIGGNQGTIQARRAFTFLLQFFNKAGKDGASYRDMLRQISGDTDEFTKSFQAMSKDPGVMWGKFVNQLKAAGLELGQAVLPTMLRLATYAERALNWWNKLSDSTKKQIATWALWGAAIAIAGSALLWLVGLGLRLFAVFGKVGGMFSVLTISLLAASAAISVLSGNWDGLNGILNIFFGLITNHGIEGFALGIGLAALGTAKLVRGINAAKAAWLGLKAAQEGTTAVSIGGVLAGGSLAGLGGGRIAKEAESAGKLKMALSGAAGALGLAGLSLGPLAIGVAAVGTAALLWKLHQDRIQADLERTRREMEAIAIIGRRTIGFSTKVGGLGIDLRSLEQAKINVRELRREITDTKRELAGQTGENRARLLDQIRSLTLQLADAQDAVHQKMRVVNKDFDAFSMSAKAVQANNIALGDYAKQLSGYQKVFQQYDAWAKTHPSGQHHGMNPFRDAADDARTNIPHIIRDIQQLSAINQEAAAKMKSPWNKAIRDLMSGGFIPKAPQRVIDSMMGFAQHLGRQMTKKEMTMFIRAELDPKALAKASADMRAWIKKQRTEATVASKVGKGLANIGQEFVKTFLPNLKPQAQKSAQAAQKAAVEFYAKHPAHMKTQVLPPNISRLRRVGEDISAGIQQGMDAKGVEETVTLIVNRYVKSFKTATESHSPSRKFAREVGKPIVEGISQGVLKGIPGLEKTAYLTMDLFAGAFLQAREQAFAQFDKDPLKMKLYLERADQEMARYRKTHNRADLLLAEQNRKKAQQVAPISMKDLIKDTQQQAAAMAKFNREIKQLRPKIPRDMLEAIEAMGIQGLKYLTLLANASDKQLRKLVNAWKRAEAETRKSQTVSLSDQKAFADQAAQNLLEMYNRLHDINEQNFGELFAGLSDKVGQGYQDALDQYRQTQADLQGQLADLNAQLADAYRRIAERQQQAIQERAAQLQEDMGKLFSGDWITGDVVQSKIQWGQKLGFDDLFKDLQGQVDKFKRWRQDLINIARRVPPELAKQLEALGPDAIPMIEALNSSTDEQLRQYVDLWQQGQNAIMDVAKNTTVDVSDIMEEVNNILKQIDEVTQKLADLQMPQPLTGQDIIDDLKKQMDQWQEYQDLLDKLAEMGLPQELLDQLSQMGPAAIPYLQALVTMTGPQLDQFVKLWKDTHTKIDEATTKMMNRQLNLWFKHGKAIAEAIIAGTASEQDALLAFFKNMFLNLLEGKFPKIDPSDGKGSPPSSGSGDSGSDGPGDNFGNSPSSSQYFDSIAPSTSSVTINQTVNATQTESLQTTLERATFRIINRT